MLYVVDTYPLLHEYRHILYMLNNNIIIEHIFTHLLTGAEQPRVGCIGGDGVR